MNEIGLFIIPIKFDSSIKTYNDYLDLACELENYGYTNLYIGEHLTDKREDIQSSIVFASAILARTKRIKVGLSVLALPHYNIKLLVKQLEDLQKLGNGRLMIGVGPGALESDANYLGINHKNRPEIFSKNFSDLKNQLSISQVFKNFDNRNIFSTILSPSPLISKILKLTKSACFTTLKPQAFRNKKITIKNFKEGTFILIRKNIIYNLILYKYRFSNFFINQIFFGFRI